MESAITGQRWVKEIVRKETLSGNKDANYVSRAVLLWLAFPL